MKNVNITLPDLINKERFEYFFKYYYLDKAILCNDKVEYFGKFENRVCRFCFKTEKHTTFKNKSHLVPELMGNDTVFSNFECDRCNSIFSKYESSLSSFLVIERLFNQMKSQKQYKHREKDSETKKINLRIHKERNGTIAMTHDFENPVLKNIDDNFSQLTITKPSYIPLNVLRIFLKIGVSLINESDIDKLKNTIDFIMNRVSQIETIENYLNILHFTIPGIAVYEFPQAALFKVKQECFEEKVPEYIVTIRYGVSMYQIYIPLIQRDHDLIKKGGFNFPIAPLIGLSEKYIKENGDYTLRIKNMSNNKKVKNENSTIVFEKKFIENNYHYLTIRKLIQ